MYDIIIFGGGLSGLTIAHEMVNKNFKVLVVEKDSMLGGMARSRIESNGIPSEHSWRGFAPFYKNTFTIMKEIPYKNSTVYDSVSGLIDFFQLYDKIKVKNMPMLSISDYLVLAGLVGKYETSDSRREKYNARNITPFLKKYLSTNGYDLIVNFMAGPGYGMNKNELSMGYLIHFISLSMTESNKLWFVTNGPTSIVWIDPWVEFLKSKGVTFLTNSSLVKINYHDDKVTSCDITSNNNLINITAKDYVFAINPFNMVEICRRSMILNLYNTFLMLTKDTKSIQISFRIGIDKDIKYPIKNIGFVMNDSEFNITWYPQEKHWSKKPIIKSLWSGTIIDFEKNGKIFGKNAESLDKAGLKKEILYQILRSDELQKMIFENNGFYLSYNDIDYFEIWYEWDYINGKQVHKNSKWVNNIHNDKYRPEQKTFCDNMYLSGAHTKTTTNIWSMEGAVESGKITTNHILTKYNMENVIHHKHDDYALLKPIRFVDNLLYSLRLPNIIITILILVFVYVVYLLVFAYTV